MCPFSLDITPKPFLSRPLNPLAPDPSTSLEVLPKGCPQAPIPMGPTEPLYLLSLRSSPTSVSLLPSSTLFYLKSLMSLPPPTTGDLKLSENTRDGGCL